MDISLNELPWFVKGYWPWVPFRQKSMETGEDLLGVTDWMTATVPGGVHFDLYKHGLIEHPYHDLNSLKCEWVRDRWWVYKTVLHKPKQAGSKLELVFKGLDYHAYIYLGRQLLGEHEGMFEAAVFDVTDWFEEAESLELKVVLTTPPDEMGQIGKTSETFTQKSRFNYKWDFSTRLIHIGIWDDVLFRLHQDASFDDCHLATDIVRGQGEISFQAVVLPHAEIQDPKQLSVHLECLDPAGQSVASCVGQITEDWRFHTTLTIENPELWYPNGSGDQPLYKVVARLVSESGEGLDDRSFETGIRSLRYAQNENSPTDALPYTFVINGKPVYIKGVNLTPLDHLYGNVTTEQYEWYVYLMKQANVNLVRVWGGGLIEKEVFYRLCDRYGILVWQDFIQSSSGVDNAPSLRPDFLELLRRNSTAALKSRRNHVSLAAWCGGNELMKDKNVPSTIDDPNLAMLQDLVVQYDPQRLFLVTSASGPVEMISKQPGVSHDVHGRWKYEGSPEHYELYSASDSLFHSEFGTDGASGMKSLQKFLSAPHLQPTTVNDSLVWRHHGEWWGTLQRDQSFFGPITDIAVYADCSQWMQMEGIRYILEANRRRQFRNSGSIVWQLNEPWPNVSCTNLVDYYGEAKLAYYGVRQAYANQHISLDYRKLQFEPGEMFEAPIYIHNSGSAGAGVVLATVRSFSGETIIEQSFAPTLEENRATLGGTLAFTVPDQLSMFFVQLQLEQNSQVVATQIYAFTTVAKHGFAPALQGSHAELQAEAIGEWEIDDLPIPESRLSFISRSYRLRNIGTVPALYIYPEERSNAYWLEASNAYSCLFPGEETIISVRCTRKMAGGLLQDDQQPVDTPIEVPNLTFHWFGSRNMLQSGSTTILD